MLCLAPVNPPLILALDTASPQVSIALAAGSRVLAEDHYDLHRSSELLLDAIDQAFAHAGLTRADLGGVVALQGPGSFTGLRIALATALGLHQATGVAATAVSSLAVLAAASGRHEGRITAAVDALRGDWCTQTFELGSGWPRELGERRLVNTAELLARTPLIGFGLAELAAGDPGRWRDVELLEPPPLAATAAILASELERPWQTGPLVQPIYFRPPAVTQGPTSPQKAG